MNIVQHLLPADQYLPSRTTKKHIVLHHTAGSSNPLLVVDTWNADPSRVATPYVVGGKSTSGDGKYDGVVVKAFDPEWDAYHLGSIDGNPEHITRTSFGIEICNWGYLTQDGDRFLTYTKKAVPADQVCDLGFEFRGYRYWHAYTDAQIASLRDLLVALIKNRFKWTYEVKSWGASSFDYAPAVFAKHTISTHTNFRRDKWDCSPQPKLLSMLNDLNEELA